MCSEQAHRLFCQACYDKLACKDCTQQIKCKGVCGVHCLSVPLHMSGINLTSFSFSSTKAKPASTANWFWMPVQNPNPMAKIGSWKLEGWSPTTTFPLLAQDVVQTCCRPPRVPSLPGKTGSAIWAPAIMCVYGLRLCVCLGWVPPGCSSHLLRAPGEHPVN